MIADTKLPVVNVGNRENPIYLPPEVCRVMPGQNSQSKLDRNQTTQMITFAIRKPHETAEIITQEGFQAVGLSPEGNPNLVRLWKSLDCECRLMSLGSFWCVGVKEIDHGPWARSDPTEYQIQTR